MGLAIDKTFGQKAIKLPPKCVGFFYIDHCFKLYTGLRLPIEKMFKKKTVLNFLLSDSHPNINHVLVKVLWKSRVFLTIINGGLDA